MSRIIAIGIFSILYLTFAIIFGKHLEGWDLATAGSCYNTHLIATPNSRHPYVDKIYLGITCIYMFSALFGSIFYSNDLFISKIISFPGNTIEENGNPLRPVLQTFFEALRTWRRKVTQMSISNRMPVLTCALLQYPLHLYSIFALRTSNQHLLTGESENTWGFSQIVALVMVGQTIVECLRGIKGIFHVLW
jgi:hypothetical protein